MRYYSGTPQRKRARRAVPVLPPVPIRMRPLDLSREAQLPIVDLDGGCGADEPPSVYKPPPPWKRQHPAIVIADNDIVSDDGDEYLRSALGTVWI